MYTYNAELIEVIDGDTLDLKVDLGFDTSISIRVRLSGVDTPEIRTTNLAEKERGLKARDFVKEIFAKNGNKCVVQTVKDKKEKYGRYLATILFKDISLNLMLLENNHKK